MSITAANTQVFSFIQLEMPEMHIIRACTRVLNFVWSKTLALKLDFSLRAWELDLHRITMYGVHFFTVSLLIMICNEGISIFSRPATSILWLSMNISIRCSTSELLSCKVHQSVGALLSWHSDALFCSLFVLALFMLSTHLDLHLGTQLQKWGRLSPTDVCCQLCQRIYLLPDLCLHACLLHLSSML